MCDWVHQEGRCKARVERANRAMDVVHTAWVRIGALQAEQATDQLDLFQPVVRQEEIDFWWGVHAAGAAEYQRMARIFNRRCHHPYVYRPLEGS